MVEMDESVTSGEETSWASNIIIGLLVLNAIVGIMIFEFAYAKTAKIRAVDEDRDKLFPAWRRLDLDNWSRWKFYPIAMTLMPIRMILIALGMLGLMGFSRVLYCCKSHELYTGRRSCRKRCIESVLTKLCKILYMMMCICNKTKKLKANEVDYSYFLGPDYREQYKEPKGIVPTIVANHCGPLDILSMCIAFDSNMGFMANDGLNIPVLGFLVQVMGGSWIPRGKDKETKDLIVKMIGEWQVEREDNPDSNKSPIAIFPEGSTSNNTRLLPFKRGAFVADKTCIPVYMKF